MSKTRKAARNAKVSEGDLDLGSDKLYFKIGEVSEIIGVPAYVLRYWESEFKAVRPQKSRAQQRVYRRRDVATLLRIKHLLYEQRFTIAGARKQLKEAPDSAPMAPASGVYLAKQSLHKLRTLLDEARSLLSDPPADRTAADPAAYLRATGGARALLNSGSSSAAARNR